MDPLHGLLWFTTIVVAGADSAVAAILAAALTVLIDALAVDGTSLLVVGILAALLGRLAARYRGAVRSGHRLVPAAAAADPDAPRRLSSDGRRLLQTRCV